MGTRALYDSLMANPRYRLHFGWTGWTSGHTALPAGTGDVIDNLREAWRGDGFRLLGWHTEHDQVQLAFSVTPDTSPVQFAARIKGRLQHGLRLAGQSVSFSRKLAVRSIGENHRIEVLDYLRRQARNTDFADPRFTALMTQFSVTNPAVDLREPTVTGSGRYWYDVHLVLVVAGRHRFSRCEPMAVIRDTVMTLGVKHGYRIAAVSVMPDHVHVALRGDISQAPAVIAGVFQNELAAALGAFRVWEDSYYVGTFGEYDLNAVCQRGGVSPAD